MMMHHVNRCYHDEETEYVGSGTTTDGTGVDVYLYAGSLGQQVCIRFGDNIEDYYTPGTLRMFQDAFNDHGDQIPAYVVARDLLAKRGEKDPE